MTEPISTGPTGPRAEHGKARSSRNATKHGFYAERNYILPDEEEEFAQQHTALMLELSPEGVLEEVHANEIMTATWRLRRCGIVEAKFADVPPARTGPDGGEGAALISRNATKQGF